MRGRFEFSFETWGTRGVSVYRMRFSFFEDFDMCFRFYSCRDIYFFFFSKGVYFR